MFKINLAMAAAFSAALMSSAAICEPVPESQGKAPSLQCMIGPARKTFGGTAWLVYACDDGKSLVIVSDQGNPASPFYFVVSPQGGAYHVTGEGNGSKDASDTAGDELSSLSPGQIAEMLVEAKDNVPPKPR